MRERYFYGSRDPIRGMPHRYSPFIFPVWSNLEKALRSDRRVAKAYCEFDPHHGYYVHIAEWNRRCAKDAVPVTE